MTGQIKSWHRCYSVPKDDGRNIGKGTKMFVECWINIWDSPNGGLFVEAFQDGESYGRVISDEIDPYTAAETYLEPFGQLVSKSDPPVYLLDLAGGIQLRVMDAE